MQQKKIPLINDQFDLAIFTHIVKKSIWIVLALITFSITGAFLYMRYTPQKFSATSILQINEQNQTTMLLNIDGGNNQDILKTIELLRSKEFLKHALQHLPLKVSYFIEGTFLSSEQYKTSPYNIEFQIDNAGIYGKPIFIYFDNSDHARIICKRGEDEKEFSGSANEWIDIPGGKIRFTVRNLNAILNQQNNYKGNEHYFVINNPSSIVNDHIRKLSIFLLNRSAQTIEVTYTGNSASKAADIANAISSFYLKYEVKIKQESSANILNFIEERLMIVRSTLDTTETELHAFKKANKINTVQFQGMGSPFPIFTTKINEFEDQLINLEFELITLKRINEEISDNSNLNIYELVASLSGTKSESIVTSALNNLQQLIFQREQLLNDITRDNLKIKILDKQINNQRQLIKDFVASTVDRLELRKEDYAKKIEEYEDKMFNDKGYNELEYSKLERLYSINEGFYHKLIDKKAEYMISQAGYVSKNTILEKAVSPKFQLSPTKKKIYPLFFLIGFFLSVAFILIRYLLYDEITSASSISNLTKAPIIGTIPTYRKIIPVSQLLVDKKLNSVFTEAFRTIRSNLQFISHGAETKIITVSSTISGEGKTFVAINLAGIIAISGKKVIILDLDLRKPRIHLGFDVPNDKGISTILIERNSIKECTRKAELENFHYITAGPVPPNPSELANSIQMENLIAELEEEYDVIIIDTPPVGIVTDALSNLQRANYPIYVMKAHVSKRHFIENINYLTNTKNMDNLSIVLNGVDLQKRRYGSYGSYGNGYGYGYYSEEDEEELSIGKKISNRIQKLKS